MWKALITGIHDRITGAQPLMNLITGYYYPRVPEGTAYPYVTLGEGTGVSETNFSHRSEDITLTFHIWAEGPNATAAADIFEAFIACLDDATLSVVGYQSVVCRREFNTPPMIDPDDSNLIHIAVRYRFVISKLK